ncbi:DMT family transporter [Bacillus sp. DTU_2020_1000418_1_SI_GHA_SEK_038]|uniref:DMT family transporter n=1 Tax=Bacillus sp. DTU_2020_1000418_1_SI_GHA_SEK_038 TaxID=3077585 RepID=UPI0028E4590E|nr:DMT family transporter [Bacillus sp. DTU_2020_1000418_1_SI_GHA_SEK_038]WNS76904.1 DMT family transporter [Bacillus sp. DTU_2020_1000418_1_SI_GHA_SEK_038]
MTFKTKLIASIYALIAISFWGISFVSTKVILPKLDPFSIIALRFGIGALFLLMILIIQRQRVLVSIHYIPHLIVLGILGIFIHQVLQATALITIDASSAGWLISFSPVFSVILSIIFLHEKMSFTKAAGMILAIIGVLLVTTGKGGQGFQLSMNIGFFLILLSTLNWAIYSILLKSLKIPYPSLLVTFYISIFGLLLTTPFLIRNKVWELLPLLSPAEWGHLLFLGIFVSGTGYWYWGKAHEVLDASKVSMFIYLEPVATFIAAILLLQEEILFISVAGGIIIIVGVLIVNGQLIPWFFNLFRHWLFFKK